MSKVVELVGKDIIDAYNGKKLSQDFGFSCANFNCEYQGSVNMKLFDIYTENVNNISCFVYINDDGEIEGRRMFFKGKQLLDHNVFPINTELGQEIYYLYGYYGNDINKFINHQIIRTALRTYPGTIFMDRGVFINGAYSDERQYWIMQIEKMDYPEFPAIDFLYASADLNAFSNFNPSAKICEWLENTYDKEIVDFGMAYHYKPGGADGGLFQHWNQKYFVEDSEGQDEDDDVQVQEVQENKIIKKFNKYK